MKVETDTIDVEIIGIGQITGKIDTGAHQSSLHATNIQVEGDIVRFEYEGRYFQSNIETEQQVSSSDGGTTTRPVITADIKVNEQTITTLLNLNDRTGMPEPLLIGQDIIRAAGLSIELPEQPSPDDDNQDPAAPIGEDPTTEPSTIEPEPAPEGMKQSDEVVDVSFGALKALVQQINVAVEALEKHYAEKSV